MTSQQTHEPLVSAGFHFHGYDLTVGYHTVCCGKPCYLMETVRCAFGSKMVIDTWIEWPTKNNSKPRNPPIGE